MSLLKAIWPIVVDLSGVAGCALSIYLVVKTGSIKKAIDIHLNTKNYKGQRKSILSKLRAARTFLRDSKEGTDTYKSREVITDMLIRIVNLDEKLKKSDRLLIAQIQNKLWLKDFKYENIAEQLSTIITKLELEEEKDV